MYDMYKTRTGYFEVKDVAGFKVLTDRIATSNHEPVELLTMPGSGNHVAFRSKGYVWGLRDPDPAAPEPVFHERMKDEVIEAIQGHLTDWTFCVMEELTDTATLMDVVLTVISAKNVHWSKPIDVVRRHAIDQLNTLNKNPDEDMNIPNKHGAMEAVGNLMLELNALSVMLTHGIKQTSILHGAMRQIAARYSELDEHLTGGVFLRSELQTAYNRLASSERRVRELEEQTGASVTK